MVVSIFRSRSLEAISPMKLRPRPQSSPPAANHRARSKSVSISINGYDPRHDRNGGLMALAALPSFPLTFRCPMPRHQLVDAILWPSVDQARQQVGEVELWIDVRKSRLNPTDGVLGVPTGPDDNPSQMQTITLVTSVVCDGCSDQSTAQQVGGCRCGLL